MSQQNLNSILVPTFRSVTLIDTDKILYLRAMQNYCRLYKDDGSHVLTSMSFGKTMELLKPYGFFQCHKSYSLKVDKVMRYLINGKAELRGGILVPIARRRKKEFLDAITP